VAIPQVASAKRNNQKEYREMTVDFRALIAPFSDSEIDWRIGACLKDKSKGIGLAYIDARLVMERLDAVCGQGNWQAKYPHANGKTSCALGIKVDGEWVWKENGAGDTDIEAAKGAFSDAFKRAAVLWGIGRYLYNMPNEWVVLENEGKKFSPEALKTLAQKHRELVAATFLPPAKPDEVKMVSDALKGAKSPAAFMEAKATKFNPIWARLSSEEKAALKKVYEDRLSQLVFNDNAEAAE
jgi:hypothetical protein